MRKTVVNGVEMSEMKQNKNEIHKKMGSEFYVSRSFQWSQ